MPLRPLDRTYLLTTASLIALIFLCLAWELWLAPLRPGGTALVFKAVPLLFPLFGILHGKRYTYKWTTLLSLLYIAEGLVRVSSETGTVQTLALIELVLASTLFAGCILYVRGTRSAGQPPTA